MLIEERREGEAIVLELTRDTLDAAIARDVKREILERAGRGGQRLVLDMRRVAYVDSSGLGAIVGALKALGGPGALELANLGPAVRKVFDLTRMSDVFVIHGEAPHA